jgi:hypothetical protein
MPNYTVRRDGNKTGDRISRGADEIYISNSTVSSIHGTLTDHGNGHYEFHDSGSKNGTFIREEGRWVRVMSADLNARDEIRFGAFVTRIGDLVGGDRAHAAPAPKSTKVKLERHPETGEIIEKKYR